MGKMEKNLLKSFMILNLMVSGGVFADTNVSMPGAVRMALEGFAEGSRSFGVLRNDIELDEGRLHAGFSNNLFWLNGISAINASIAFPRYETKLITNYVTTIIPGGIIGYRTVVTGTENVLVGYETVVTGTESVLTGYETVVTGSTIVGYTPSSTGTNDIGPVTINGERTLNGWAIDARANYLRSLDPSLSNRAAKDLAANDLSSCYGPNSCSVDIGTPTGVKITSSNNGSCSSPSNCNAEFTITGGFYEPSTHNGNHHNEDSENGAWKPTFSAKEEVEIPGQPIYEDVTEKRPVYEERPVYEKKPVYEEKEITEEKPVYEEKETTEEEPIREEDKEETKKEEAQQTQRAKQEWKLSFAPIVTVDSEFSKLVLNQAGGMEDFTKGMGEDFTKGMFPEEDFVANVAAGSQGQQQVRACVTERQQRQNEQYVQASQQAAQQQMPSFVLRADDCGPYLVKKHFSISVGAGVSMTASLTNAGLFSAFGISAAILPTIGGGAYSTRTVDTKEEAKKAPYLKIPRDVSDFNNWRNGDSLQYDVNGGIVFSGGAGWMGLSAGVTYVAQGDWKKIYVKIDEDTVFAKLDKDRLQSFGAYISAAVVSLSAQKFITSEDGVGFTFDISKEDGRTLLENFMHGSLREVQAAAMTGRDSAVLAGFHSKGRTHGHGLSASVGIPYLPMFARWNTTEMSNNTETSHLGSDRTEDETNNGSVKTFKGQLFTLFNNKIEGFFTRIKKFNGATSLFINKVISGQYAFNYQKGNTRVSDLTHVLEDLKEKTGLFDFLDVKFPEGLEKVGSSDLKFGVRLKTAATKYLMKYRESISYEKIAQKYIDGYFNELSVAPAKTFNICNRTAKTLVKACKRRLERKTMKAISKMKKYLLEMESIKGDDKKARTDFTEAYNNFGKAMMETPFAFQTVLNMTKGNGADVYLSIETSETEKHEAILQWNPIRN